MEHKWINQTNHYCSREEQTKDLKKLHNSWNLTLINGSRHDLYKLCFSFHLPAMVNKYLPLGRKEEREGESTRHLSHVASFSFVLVWRLSRVCSKGFLCANTFPWIPVCTVIYRLLSFVCPSRGNTLQDVHPYRCENQTMWKTTRCPLRTGLRDPSSRQHLLDMFFPPVVNTVEYSSLTGREAC